ncbi:hypothetical protein ABKV19_005470 [Rosa sericea]
MAGSMVVRGTQPYKRHRLHEEEAEVGEEIMTRLQKHKDKPWLPTKLVELGHDVRMIFNNITMGNHRIGNLRTVILHNLRPQQVDQVVQIRGIDWSRLSTNFEERMYNSEILETESSYMHDSSDEDNNNLPLLSSTQERQRTETLETESSYMQDSSDVDIINFPLPSSTQERQTTNTSSEWIFIVISLVLEGLSLAFDQIASPRKPYYGLIGMLLAIVALLVTTWEFVRKIRKEIVKSRRRGMLRRFHYPHSHSSIYGTLPDIYGIFGGIAQFVCSAVQYAYLRRYAESPIQASLLPAIFLLCLGTVKITESRSGTSGDARPHICQICRQTTANGLVL